MRNDPRPRVIAAGGFWGTMIALIQAAFAPDPFHSITASLTALTVVLLAIHLIEGKRHRNAQEKERSCQSN